MTVTVAELFCAFKKADEISLNAGMSGKFDGEAALAIARFLPAFWRCSVALELSAEQTEAFKKYQAPVPK